MKKNDSKPRAEYEEWVESIKRGQIEILNIVKNKPGVDLKGICFASTMDYRDFPHALLLLTSRGDLKIENDGYYMSDLVLGKNASLG